MPFVGDTGAAVVRKDGTVLGLIIGASKQISIACPIGPILDEFDCDIMGEDG